MIVSPVDVTPYFPRWTKLQQLESIYRDFGSAMSSNKFLGYILLNCGKIIM